MPNLLLTNVCNLSCKYCFAHGVNQDQAQFLTMETLGQVIKFLQHSHCQEIGLIGGEPTLHPQFGEILSRLVEKEHFRKVFVYSNGIALERFFPDALKLEVCYLINVNDPKFIGEERFQAIRHMLTAAQQLHHLEQFSLGINLFEECQSFEPALQLCTEFGFRALRLSVVVPKNTTSARDYFFQLKPTLMALYHRLKELHITPKYDCNIVPPCMFTQEELQFLRTMPGSPEDIARITGAWAVCKPVVDIYPDLSVARCFGFSDKRHHKLTDFSDISDVERCMIYETDLQFLGKPPEICAECYLCQTLRCFGGCLRFRRKE